MLAGMYQLFNISCCGTYGAPCTVSCPSRSALTVTEVLPSASASHQLAGITLTAAVIAYNAVTMCVLYIVHNGHGYNYIMGLVIVHVQARSTKPESITQTSHGVDILAKLLLASGTHVHNSRVHGYFWLDMHPNLSAYIYTRILSAYVYTRTSVQHQYPCTEAVYWSPMLRALSGRSLGEYCGSISGTSAALSAAN